MPLVEVSGSCDVLVGSAGSAVRILHNPIGDAAILVDSAGSVARIAHAPSADASILIETTGDFADIPPVASVVVLTETTMRVNFDQEMDGSGASGIALADPNSYSFAPTSPNTVGIAANSATPEAVANPNYVDLVVTEMTDGGIYELTVNPAAVDLGGSPVAEPAEFTGQGAAPQVSAAVALNSTKVKVTFNEPMRVVGNNELSKVANYSIVPTGGGAAVFVQQIDPEPGVSPTYVEVICSEMTDGAAYDITVATTVQDAAGNTLDPGFDTASFTGVGIRPQILLLEAQGKNRIDVIFDEPMRDNASIRDPANYTWDNGLVTLSVLEVEADRVKLVTSDQDPGLLYTLTLP